MPNTGVMVQTGAAVLSAGTKANDQDIELVQSLFSAVGTCDQAPESMLDAVTALSGSGPAYVLTTFILTCTRVNWMIRMRIFRFI